MKVWGMKRWAGFGKSARHGRAQTNFAPNEQVLRIAEAAAAGEYKSKALVIAGRLLMADKARGDGFWDFGAKRLISSKI
jgi:hypothetical protein